MRDLIATLFIIVIFAGLLLALYNNPLVLVGPEFSTTDYLDLQFKQPNVLLFITGVGLIIFFYKKLKTID